MSDIFDEISTDLRRDRLTRLWRTYGVYAICGAVAVVLIIAGVIGYGSITRVQHEAASGRYDAMLDRLESIDSGAERIAILSKFIEQENNGYGVLASLRAGVAEAENGQSEAALARFDTLGTRGDLPLSLRDFARLQAAIVLLDQKASVEDIEARLARLLADGNGLKPAAREVLALANMMNEQPLIARGLLMEQVQDDIGNNLSRDRAQILLQSVEKQLRKVAPDPVKADQMGVPVMPVPEKTKEKNKDNGEAHTDSE